MTEPSITGPIIEIDKLIAFTANVVESFRFVKEEMGIEKVEEALELVLASLLTGLSVNGGDTVKFLETVLAHEKASLALMDEFGIPHGEALL